jgi:hypothetical protein
MIGLEGRASSRWAERRACNVLQSLMETRLCSTVLQSRFDVSLVVCKNSIDGGRDHWHQGRSLTRKKVSALGSCARARAHSQHNGRNVRVKSPLPR